MSFTPSEIRCLKDLRPSDDGKRIAFTIETTNGDTADLSCAVEELPEIMCFLVHGALHATERSGSQSPTPTVGQEMVAEPIPARGIGLAAGRSAEETLVLLHLAGLDLVFGVPSSELARLAPDLARIATTLSAPSTRPQ
jgi:hypothetical protein